MAMNCEPLCSSRGLKTRLGRSDSRKSSAIDWSDCDSIWSPYSFPFYRPRSTFLFTHFLSGSRILPKAHSAQSRSILAIAVSRMPCPTSIGIWTAPVPVKAARTMIARLSTKPKVSFNNSIVLSFMLVLFVDIEYRRQIRWWSGWIHTLEFFGDGPTENCNERFQQTEHRITCAPWHHSLPVVVAEWIPPRRMHSETNT